MYKFKMVGIVILALLIGFIFGIHTLSNQNTPLQSTSPQTTQKPVSSPTNPLDTQIMLDTPKGVLMLTNAYGSVIVNPDNEGKNLNYKSISINKDEYPGVFKQGDENDDLLNYQFKTTKSGQYTIVLTKMIPDHGGLLPLDNLDIDPVTGTVTESSPKP